MRKELFSVKYGLNKGEIPRSMVKKDEYSSQSLVFKILIVAAFSLLTILIIRFILGITE